MLGSNLQDTLPPIPDGWVNVSTAAGENSDEPAKPEDLDSPEADVSIRLWNKAYNSIKREKCDLVLDYQKILTEQLTEGMPSFHSRVLQTKLTHVTQMTTRATLAGSTVIFFRSLAQDPVLN